MKRRRIARHIFDPAKGRDSKGPSFVKVKMKNVGFAYQETEAKERLLVDRHSRNVLNITPQIISCIIDTAL